MNNNKKKTFRLLIPVLAMLITISVLSTIPALAAKTDISLPANKADEITTWYAHNWNLIQSPYTCNNFVAGCWANPNYHEPSWLMSQQSVFIDPAWQSPSLVFWTKYSSKKIVNFCYVEIQVEGSRAWDRIKTYGGTKNYWHQVTLDLMKYSGKKIQVKFQCEPNLGYPNERARLTYNKQIFYVDDVSILANPPTP